METITTVTPASVAPVSTDDLKTHLRLNDSSEDTLLADWVTAGADLFARETGYVLTATTLRLNLDHWPTTNTIYIPRHPVTSITSVQYLDTAGSWQTVSSSDYTTDLDSVPARVTFKDTFAFPELHATQTPKIKVVVVAGHALAADCPRLALVGLKLLCAHWYQNRESTSEVELKEVPSGWKAVTDQYQTGVIGNWNEVK